MQKIIALKLTPSDAANSTAVIQWAAAALAVPASNITGYYITKQSIDARSRQQIWINLSINVFVNEPYNQRPVKVLNFKQVTTSKYSVLIIGAGPAGLFAALQLLKLGIKPIIIERGKDVKNRRKDLAQLNRYGNLNTESNYCFGEGGAGTYSDGKLYTRSNKRGSIDDVLNLFVQFGAEEKILYQAHPHIGTNKLPAIISAMSQCIIEHGGEIHFEEKLTDIQLEKGKVKSISTAKGHCFTAHALILATGHSAADVFELLHYKNIAIEAKPFALGVRVEHAQQIIDACQYHLPLLNKNNITQRPESLPPAAYSLVQQVNGRGVFSFCMCPGGIIAPAATHQNQLVVNGWSPSKRNNPYANSGMVVQVNTADIALYKPLQKVPEPLQLLHFQKMVEATAYTQGGGNFVAPAQRLVDFCTHQYSASLPNCSYHPGLNSVLMKNVLPKFINTTLQQGFKAFGQKLKGFYTNEAVVVGVESRTSSPVKIPRDADYLHHIHIKNLYPCAEGAGYAGGIVSAAMDGQKVANAIAQALNII